MKKHLCLLTSVLCLLAAGCSTTNLTKIISELKQDPATVEFSILAPGWTVQFKRAWPTNLLARPSAPASFYVPAYQVPPTPPVPFTDPHLPPVPQ